jgi:hypothetical protein
MKKGEPMSAVRFTSNFGIHGSFLVWVDWQCIKDRWGKMRVCDECQQFDLRSILEPKAGFGVGRWAVYR